MGQSRLNAAFVRYERSLAAGASLPVFSADTTNSCEFNLQAHM